MSCKVQSCAAFYTSLTACYLFMHFCTGSGDTRTVFRSVFINCDPTLRLLLRPLPLQLQFQLQLQLQLTQHGGSRGDGGVRGQDGDARGHGGGRGDLVRPEASADQLEVDCLAGVAENLHSLLVGVSLDVEAVHLQGETKSKSKG